MTPETAEQEAALNPAPTQALVVARDGAEFTGSPALARVLATLTADLISVILSSYLALLLVSLVDGWPLFERVLANHLLEPPLGAWMLAVLIPWWIFVFYAFGLYREPTRSIGGSSGSETLRGLTAIIAGTWFLLLALVMIEGDASSLAFLVAFWLVASVVVTLGRRVARATVWAKPVFAERALIVGAGTVGHALAAKIAKHPEYRLRLMGFLDDGEPIGQNGGPPVPVVGTLADLDRAIDAYGITRVIVAFTQARHQQILTVVRTCADRGVKVNIVPRLFEVLSTQAGVDDIEGIPLLDVAHAELGRFNLFVKRVFDLLVAGLTTMVAAPAMAAIAVAIKLDSPGPVFFRQDRMGRGGKTFKIIKFRSMKLGAEKMRRDLDELNEYSGPMFKMRDDPRLTRVGRLLRRSSLDELPQLLNVLLGDMSLVGPRPLWVEEAKQCRGWTQKRLDITPGITGLWQVLGRSEIPFDEMVKLDYLYVTGWTLSWDVRLLFQTVPAVFGRRGAY